MFGWLKELQDIRFESRQRLSKLKVEIKEAEVRLEPEIDNSVICESCETLKQQLAIANAEKKQLLDRLLEKPKEEVIQQTSDLTPIKPKGAGRWQDQRRELEANDRRVASILKAREEEIKATSPKEVAEFEKELDEVTKQREGTTNA